MVTIQSWHRDTGKPGKDPVEADLDGLLPAHFPTSALEEGEKSWLDSLPDKSCIVSEDWVAVSPHLWSPLGGGEGQAEHVLRWTAVRVKGEPWGQSHQQRGGSGSFSEGLLPMVAYPRDQSMSLFLLSLAALSKERALSSGWSSQGRMKAMSGVPMK